MRLVVLSPAARRDLAEIGAYIRSTSGSRETARRFVQSIRQECDLLATQPEMGELRVDFRTGQYRSFSVGNYVIYFKPTSTGIRIARILHGARDHHRLL